MYAMLMQRLLQHSVFKGRMCSAPANAVCALLLQVGWAACCVWK